MQTTKAYLGLFETSRMEIFAIIVKVNSSIINIWNGPTGPRYITDEAVLKLRVVKKQHEWVKKREVVKSTRKAIAINSSGTN